MEYTNEHMEHVGIIGMKWGRRKNSSARISKKKESFSEDYQKKATLKKKKINQMSNSELKTLNERLQLERQYKDLTSKDVSAGRKFVTDIMKDLGKESLKTAIKAVAKDITTSAKDGSSHTVSNKIANMLMSKKR